MSKPNIANDLCMVLNGVRKVLNTSIQLEKAGCETTLKNSSLKAFAQEFPKLAKQAVPDNPKDLLERASVVPRAAYQFSSVALNSALKNSNLFKSKRGKADGMPSEVEITAYPFGINPEGSINADNFGDDDIMVIREEELEDIYLRSLGVEILQQNEDGKKWVQQYENMNERSAELREAVKRSILDESPISIPDLRAGESQPAAKVSPKPNVQAPSAPKHDISKENMVSLKKKLKPLSTQKPKSQLSPTSKERKVPATRLSRLVSYGGLAAGLGIGALTEITKRGLGLRNPKAENSSLLETSPFLSEANAERIVDTLCRVRGAALKIGQILSIQDNTMINPELQKVFERVRHAADFMPSWQMEKMLQTNFGLDWRSRFLEFDEKPFAAASIGQVHLGKLHDGRPVAIKIQYPGVAQGIESDIDNLMSVLSVWSILPEGIFADNLIEVAKRELAWEVDYIRESNCAKIFRKLLENHPDYYVPEVIDELSTSHVFTTELIEGLAVDKCANMDQETRDRISYLLLDLFFQETFVFRFMQTDPNWSNFIYNKQTEQVGLLDFGASREYGKEFTDKYIRIFHGAAHSNVKQVMEASKDIGFLTGYESKTMEKAHLDTVMILGEAFRTGEEPYDFGTQKVTTRIQELVPVMVRERLCPPPEEIYSLHRKLSGIFLLCAKLKGRVKCKPIFDRIWENYKFGPDNRTVEERLNLK